MSIERERFELKVGIFVFVGIVALGALIIVLGSKQEMFSRQYALYTEFEQVGGLKQGAPVRLSGVDVGIVDGISFPDDPSSRKLKVRLLIRSNVRERIRQDSKASIANRGVLGDKYVKISLGTKGDPVRRGATIVSEKPADYMALADSAGDLLGRLTSIATKVDVLMSSSSGGEAVQSLGGVFASVEEILGEVKNGDGLLHTLIYDDEAARTFRELQTASANLAAITGEIRESGAAKILADPKTKESLSKAMDAMANLEKASADGAVAAANMRSVMERIDRGEGTVGALINDPAVYDDLRSLLGGAKRNRILRGVIRHTIDKNEKIDDVTVKHDGSDSTTHPKADPKP